MEDCTGGHNLSSITEIFLYFLIFNTLRSDGSVLQVYELVSLFISPFFSSIINTGVNIWLSFDKFQSPLWLYLCIVIFLTKKNRQIKKNTIYHKKVFYAMICNVILKNGAPKLIDRMTDCLDKKREILRFCQKMK